MDQQTVIYLITAFIAGCVIAWIIAKQSTIKKIKEMEADLSQTSTQKEENITLKNQVLFLQESLDKIGNENSILKENASQQEALSLAKLQESERALKEKYDILLQKIKEENLRLDSALKLATEGKIDESIKAQLASAEKSALTIKEMENELSSLREQHASLIAEKETLRASFEESNAECSKLNKKIKKLEDEVEEAEEEQAELEKKLKGKTQELQESREELEKFGRENKRLQSDLKQKEDELATRIEELKRKSGSIEFVQEILSAPEAGARDVKALYKSIDFFESFLKGQFMDCNAYLYNTYPGLSFNDVSGQAGFVEKKRLFTQMFEEWASVKRKSWLDKKTTIAFVGEFSAGKTSIVNRILSQDNPNIPLLPVSTKATTAIPTYIAGGVAETFNFVTPNDRLKAITESAFKKVSKEVLDEIKGVSSLIKYFVMTYKNPNLNRLSILDTPGFNSNDSEDKARTIDVINECDALFWVFDVNAGTVNRSSISLIKERLNKPLFVVINKVDTKPKSEVDKVETLIRKTLTDENLKVEKFIRFSAKAPLQDIMNPIKSINHDNSRDAFIATVDEDIQQLLDILSNGVKEADSELQNCNNKAQEITDRYIEALRSLYSACDEAAGIPHWETHFFGSDRFEMSADEGNRLLELLKDIAENHTDALSNIYDEEMDAVSEAQQAYSNLLELKVSWQKMEDCQTEFKKTTKNLK